MKPTYEELQQRISELEQALANSPRLQLMNIQQQIDSVSNIRSDLKSSLALAFKYLIQINWVDCGGIYILNANKKAFELAYSAGLSDKFVKLVSTVPLTDTFARYLLEKTPLYISEPDFAEELRKEMTDEGLKSEAVIPLVYKDKVIGALNLGSRNISQIDEFDKKIIESIAARLANLIMLVKTQNKLDTTNRELKTKLQEISIKQQMLIQKSRLESLGEMSAGLAHEINQPLSVISLVLENIQYKFEQKMASEDYLANKFLTITQNINKIKDLIDHVRIFSRDQGTLMFERVDVNHVILNALSMIESQLKSFQIKTIPDLGIDIGYTIGNPSRFEQVMLNLLSNARDALVEKENKSITGGRSKEIRISTSKQKDQIFVRVWDNGSGISPENLDKIFNPFFTTKTEGRGTGLGLPIVYGIITEMKGKITARSIEGEFTEMIVTLPHYKKM
jgi:signal transduction histidine kinase